MNPYPTKTAPSPAAISLTKVLLVEGDTDVHFFEALLKHLGIADQIEIRKFGGVAKFKSVFAALAASDEFKHRVTSVGIVRDADEQNLQDVQISLTDAINAAGLSPTVKHAWFIFPDNNHRGMIETLWMEAIKQEPGLTQVRACIDGFFDCLRINQVAIPADHTLAKNQAQVFLATCPEVQLPPGIAASRGYFPLNSPVFDALKQFLCSL